MQYTAGTDLLWTDRNGIDHPVSFRRYLDGGEHAEVFGERGSQNVGIITLRLPSVVAEDAPIGVQLWPTVTPDKAPNFTLMEVRTVRRAERSHVTWIYENGRERHFDLGERIAVWIQK